MWNASDFVAMTAIAAGTAGSAALYSALVERQTVEVRTIVVEELRGPAVDPPVRLRLHHLDPPRDLRAPPVSGDLRIQHVPYVVFERLDPRAEPSFEVDGRHFRLYRDGRAVEIQDGRAVEIEERRHPRPDRKRRRPRRDRP